MADTEIPADHYDDLSLPCREDKRGPQQLKVCLPSHPGKVFYPYRYTTHMTLFHGMPPVFGNERHKDVSSNASTVCSSEAFETLI